MIRFTTFYNSSDGLACIDQISTIKRYQVRTGEIERAAEHMA